MHFRDWYAADPRRRVPEVDFGRVWTDHNHPDQQWSVSWNPGTGELYTFNQTTHQITVLAVYETIDDVEHALEGWAEHALQRGGMAWLRTRTAPEQPAVAPPEVYGILVTTDGRLDLLTRPVDHAVARRLLNDATLDTASVTTAHSAPGELMMYVDDNGHAKELPVNPTATALYGTGWPIRGDVVICHNHDQPLRPPQFADIANLAAGPPQPPPPPTGLDGPTL